MQKETVFVGLSGGVDSAVAALRLKQQGHDVVGVFIKVWQPDFLRCNWERERIDAMRVASHLDIPFLTFDAEGEYKRHVADYMINEYKLGRTPNPDVMCNQYVKFGVFLDFARSKGAHRVGTGHYAQVREADGTYHLLRGIDANKDQSYFLWTLTQEQLGSIYFPIGDTRKPDIREEARRAGLPVFQKHDSQGICFLGEVDIPEFLSHYIHMEKGLVIDESGNTIGEHGGAILYTLGQRHGFLITVQESESLPHYVIAKDLTKNTITVSSTSIQAKKHAPLLLTDVRHIDTGLGGRHEAQFRYRQKPFTVTLGELKNGCAMLTVVTEGIPAPSSGQSCVLYDGAECLGGGIIA